MSHDQVLSGDNDYLIEREIFTRRETDGAKIPAAGLTGGIGYIALSDGGPAAHASLSVVLQERSAKPGTYYGVLQGDAIATQVAAQSLDGKVIWECVQFASDYRAYIKVRARAVRVVA